MKGPNAKDLEDIVNGNLSVALAVGDRLFIGGGSDYEADWLGEDGFHEGTVERFIQGQGKEAAVVVRLDRPIRLAAMVGDLIVLELRYTGASWAERGIVHIELCDFDPADQPWQRRRRGKWIESHGYYELSSP